MKKVTLFILLIDFFQLSIAQEHYEQQLNISGVLPELAMTANHAPRTEAGTGALMPWANRLWVITYVAHMKGTGAGTGLYEINDQFKLRRREESLVGTYANRLIHGPSHQLIIGPYLIDTLGNVRTIDGVKEYRLAATMLHLTDPKNMVYFLSMEGDFFEVNINTLETKYLFDLKKELMEPAGSKPHFKSGFTHQGRVVVANNSYNEKDFNREWQAGRLAEWNGKEWVILEKTAFTEVYANTGFGQPMFATGWDNRSVILKALINGEWKRYRLPKSSYAFDQTSLTEWMRIREVETERALMDCHGIFYEISYHTYGNGIWGIRPISNHLRVIPDFCSWKGMLVLRGNQATPMQFSKDRFDRNPLAGQPQAGLWFGKTDDLWSFGKPAGSGGVWLADDVVAEEASDPYLMIGFDKKVLHLQNLSSVDVEFTLQVDFIGNGDFVDYKTVKVTADGYLPYEFPAAFSAHWIRLKSNKNCRATAYFIYS